MHWLWNLSHKNPPLLQPLHMHGSSENNNLNIKPCFQRYNWRCGVEVVVCTIILARLSMWYFETLSSQKHCVIVDDQRHIDTNFVWKLDENNKNRKKLSSASDRQNMLSNFNFSCILFGVLNIPTNLMKRDFYHSEEIISCKKRKEI